MLSLALAPRPLPQSPRALLRDLVLPLAAFGSVFLFPGNWFLAGFLIIGQAHFAMTFLYQYRGKKMTRGYGLIALVTVFALVAYFSFGGTFLPIFLVTATLFAAHFSNDEFMLHEEAGEREKLPVVVLFATLFLALILYSLFPQYLPLAILMGLVFAGYALVRSLSAPMLSTSERYVFLVGSLLLILALGAGVPPEVLLSLVIILHCLNWYVDYGKRTAEKGDARVWTRYWLEVAVTLVVSISLYVLYLRYDIPFLHFAFLPMYYDAWALAHFALTSRFLASRIVY